MILPEFGFLRFLRLLCDCGFKIVRFLTVFGFCGFAVLNTYQESQLTQSASLLEESRAKCEMYEEKVSLHTLYLDKTETAMGTLKSELVLKAEQSETMEMRRKEEIKRLADETNEKFMKQVMKMNHLKESLTDIILVNKNSRKR